jgi:alpha-beta hydrolase superfamily lysophospholipase
LRSYLPLFGEGLSGAVICGTAQETPAVAQAGNVLARSLAKKKGEGYRSKLLFNLADGAYNKSIKHPKTPFDWLARNEAVPQAYMADDLCGFMFGAGAYAALTELAFRAAARETLKKTPRHLPLFYIAGEEDPVGGCGKGVRAAAQAMMKAGSDDVSLKLYPGMRHEILNEVGNDLVYRDVLSWINDKTAQ